MHNIKHPPPLFPIIFPPSSIITLLLATNDEPYIHPTSFVVKMELSRIHSFFFIGCNLFWLLLTCRTSSIFTICASISPRKSDKSSRKKSSSSPHCSIASVQSITWGKLLAGMMKMMAMYCLLCRYEARGGTGSDSGIGLLANVGSL